MVSNRVTSRRLYQTGGGVPPEEVQPEMAEIVQAVQAGLQSGMAPHEVVLQLATQGYPQDEISFALEQIGYDPSAVTTIMQQAEAMYMQQSQQQMPPGMQPEIQPGMEPSMKQQVPPGMERAQMRQAASPQTNVGNMQDEGISEQELAIALQRAASKAMGKYGKEMQYGGNIYYGENVSAYPSVLNPYAPKPIYMPTLPEKGSLGYALLDAADAFAELFSGKTGANGMMKGALRDLKAKKALWKQEAKPRFYSYDVTLDKNDPNQYVPDIKDMYEGKLRTKQQYQEDINKFSRTDYDTKTGKYNTLATSRELNPNVIGKKQRPAFEKYLESSTGLGEWAQRFDPETKAMLLENERMAPSGTTIGISPTGQSSSYMDRENNPYLYNTMMGINTLGSKPYSMGVSVPTPNLAFPNMEHLKGLTTVSPKGILRDVGIPSSGISPETRVTIPPREYVNKSRSMMVPYNPATEGVFGFRNGGMYLPKAQMIGAFPPEFAFNNEFFETPETTDEAFKRSMSKLTPSISPGVKISNPSAADDISSVTAPTARESFESKPSIVASSPMVSTPKSFKEWYAQNASRPDVMGTPNRSSLEEMWKKETNQVDALGTTTVNNTAQPAAKSPVYEQPKIDKKFNVSNWMNAQMQSPGMKAFAKTSNALVKGASAVNEMFTQREYDRYDDKLRKLTAADNTFGTVYNPVNKRGTSEENTGRVQPDKYVTYLTPDSFYPMPGKSAKYGGQKDDVFNVDMKTLTQLIAAGADIEIL